ncbi:LPS export ABC transporter periplasmic protein LptC [Litoreibacter roseus]|uniref:Lipopolysaccharide export system protein LptC n=1 Tax=Litoreibacter roseus TaxID=2601869 RepID=A0A6N6JE15_9RHOB|nr:LPS export ABC transporter periplasmic protein LptC [Litoreibacter roseus]GFE64583.1 hypothetical protein KIN_16570 [Litoreibacter roseus]
MASRDNRYSRFVQWAKVLFPLLALALLSTLFLFSRTLDPSDAIPFAEIDVEQIANEQRLADPKFSGVTGDGSEITVDAKYARPDLTNPRRLMAEEVIARIETTTGHTYVVISDHALFDDRAATLNLTGNVRINSSAGYDMRTQELLANLETTGLSTPGAVSATGPYGTIDAGRMKLTGPAGSELLVFQGGVKLVYKPDS